MATGFRNLTFLRQYGLFVCVECQEATTYGQLNTHLWKIHGYDITSRNETLSWALGVVGEDAVKRNPGLQTLPVPEDTTHPIEGLGPARSGGYRCAFSLDSCPFVGATERRIREHLIHTHDWQPPRSRAGRPNRHGTRQAIQRATAAPSGPWRSGVYYQRFARRGAYSKWFEVGRIVESKPNVETGISVPNFSASSRASNTSLRSDQGLQAAEKCIQDEQYKLERLNSLPARFRDVWFL